MSRQINALLVQKNLLARMVDFSARDHFVRDASLGKSLRTLWSGPGAEGGLAGELWVEGAFPAKSSGVTVETLGKQGNIHQDLIAQLHGTRAFPRDRAPFTHQVESLDAGRQGYVAPSGQRPAIVVSAGTGAGKTESFLLPILDDLYRNQPADERDGVSAIILYPMNALVNDQVDRLVSWLKGQKKVTAFHFTGETPETVRDAQKRGIPAPDQCTYYSRKHARGCEDRQGKPTKNPGPLPRILITNYSMLEYMLCRPQDRCFFGANLRSIVLDEAHLYTGNLAAEISLLLRRVCEESGVASGDLVHYATSATLGDKSPGGQREIRDFAARLFGKKSAESVKLILGDMATSEFPEKGSPVDFSSLAKVAWEDNITAFVPELDGEPRLASLAEDSEELKRLSGALAAIADSDVKAQARVSVTEAGSVPIGPFVRKVMLKSQAAAVLDYHLRQDRFSLSELAKRVTGSDSIENLEAVRRLLTLGAMARNDAAAYPLLPNRIHLMIRTPEGVEVTWNSTIGQPVSEQAFRLVSPASKPEVLDNDETYRLSLARINDCGDWYLAGVDNDAGQLVSVPQPVIRAAWDNPDALAAVRYFSTVRILGAPLFHFDPRTGRLGGEGEATVRLFEVFLHDKPKASDVGFFAKPVALYLSVLAEAALMEMPVFPREDRAWKPAEGRRLLVFSDNRREAAKLGPAFTAQHEQRIIRAALADTLAKESLVDSGKILAELAALKAAASSAPAIFAQLIKEKEAELERATADVGIAMDAVPDRLRLNSRLMQLFHRQSGGSHSAMKWTQHSWEQNAQAAAGELQQMLADEFGRRSVWPDLTTETLGFAEVVYPGLEKLDMPPLPTIPSPVVRTLSSVWANLVAEILDGVRTTGCVGFRTPELERNYGYGANLVGKWMSIESSGQHLVPMCSSANRSQRHHYIQAVLRAAGHAEDGLGASASALLAAVFNFLLSNAPHIPWLIVGDRETQAGSATQAFQIHLFGLNLRCPKGIYCCSLTGEVRPRSVFGINPAVCKEGPAAPTLDTVSRERLLDLPLVGLGRRELIESPIFKNGVWAEEHTAQISQGDNRRIQDLFKEGIRNILSSTTTLEMGIDIGGLQGVLMGNTPPGKANYLQRAGRAGRRADGSSLVLGFVRNSPYERQVFLDFGAYLRSPFRKPTILTSRHELVMRHVNAFLFGLFFRSYQGPHAGAMTAFFRMGALTGRAEIPYWPENRQKPQPEQVLAEGEQPLRGAFSDYLEGLAESPDKGVVAAIRRICADAAETQNAFNDDRLADTFRDIEIAFDKAVDSWDKDYNELLDSWSACPNQNGVVRARANAIYFQAKQYHSLTTIETLANRRFLPRYGFPVGLHRLRVAMDDGQGRVQADDRVRLERESVQSLREYVPGSVLLVGGRYVRSRGLLKNYMGNNAETEDSGLGLTGRYINAKEVGFFQYSKTVEEPKRPENLQGAVEHGTFLLPKHGFTTAAWDPPAWRGKAEAVGTVETHTVSFLEDTEGVFSYRNFGGASGLTVKFNPAGEIVAINGGENGHGFAICTTCGYADSESYGPTPDAKGALRLPPGFETHGGMFDARENRCSREGQLQALRHHRLAAEMHTHMALFDFFHWLRPESAEHRAIANTIAQSLRLAAADILELDAREIRFLKPLMSPGNSDGLAVVLYDSVSGGAGHLEDLCRNRSIMWFSLALAKLTPPPNVTPVIAERNLLRRLITADSPRDRFGDADYAPLAAYDLMRRIADGTAQPVNPTVPPNPPPPPAPARPRRKA